MLTAGQRRARGLAAVLSTLILVTVVALVLVSGLWDRGEDPAPAQSLADASARTDDSPEPEAAPAEHVVVVSVDGLASYAVTQATTPTLAKLIYDGTGTANARTAERTVTLPNHTGMVTGRPILEALGGHGVDWNSDRQDATVRSGVDSVFTVLDQEGMESAVFAGKTKFELWDRSWPGTIDRLQVFNNLDQLVDVAVADIRTENRALTFIHLAAPDVVGHRIGWGTKEYYEAVTRADRAISRVVEAISDQQTILIVTADHGGVRGTRRHVDFTEPEAYTIPFVVWGPGVARGDLYQLNDDYADPGTAPPTYDPPPSIRNAAVANMVTDLLGLGAVPGSSINAAQDLDVLTSTLATAGKGTP